MPGKPQLTELERMRVRTLHLDAEFRVSRIAQVTGYGVSQIRRAIKDPTPKKRPGRPRKHRSPDEADAATGEATPTPSRPAGNTKAAGKARAPAKPKTPARPTPSAAAQSPAQQQPVARVQPPDQPSDQQSAVSQTPRSTQLQPAPAQAQTAGSSVPPAQFQPTLAPEEPALAQTQPLTQPQAADQSRGPTQHEFSGQPPISMQPQPHSQYPPTAPDAPPPQPYAMPRNDQAAGPWDARQNYWPAYQRQ